jgi:hypothetical protein
MMLAVLLLLLMGLIGFAALDTVTRDLQVEGAQFRKKLAFYAAEAGVAEALETLRNAGEPTVTTTQLADAGTFPYGRPTYSLDPSTADPVKSLGLGGYPGMNLQLGQNGAPQFQMEMYRVRVQGTATGGSVSRLEVASGVLVAN